MQLFLSVNHNQKIYRVSDYISVPTSGDFFKQLFINRQSWDAGLEIRVIYNGNTELLGTVQYLHDMPLIYLCRIASRYYGSSRMRALPSTENVRKHEWPRIESIEGSEEHF